MEPKFYDLSAVQFDDGTVQLVQKDCGEEYVIAAHPMQLAYYAHKYNRAPVPAPQPIATADDVPDEMHSLSISREPGELIAIEQTIVQGMGGSDERILIHPTQAAWLAARLLELAAMPVETPGASKTFSGGAILTEQPSLDVLRVQL